MADQTDKTDTDPVGTWLVEQFGGTWKHWKGGPAGIPGADLWAQYRTDADGKKVMVGMLLLSDGITSARLRAIPVGVLEASAATEEAGGPKHLEAELAELPPLARRRVPSGFPPEEFYRLVAAHYRVWAKYSSTPVAEMVRASGENPATVHAWVNRARRRGLLPAAERGKRARG